MATDLEESNTQAVIVYDHFSLQNGRRRRAKMFVMNSLASVSRTTWRYYTKRKISTKYYFVSMRPSCINGTNIRYVMC